MVADDKKTQPLGGRRLPGRPAGQREDLVARLRNLAHDYPAGLGILKELLQNADDAGATSLRFVLDLRQHRSVELPDPRMAPLLGPALLVKSDQSFTDEDLANIQRIGAAGKVDEVGKSGRFGLGFNTVYSVTDYPSFATQGLIRTFDPHLDAVAGPDPEPGREWDLADLWAGAADWPRAFGLPEGATTLDHTVFRLPLRTEAMAGRHRISPRAFPAGDLEDILGLLADQGTRLLLFLRSVIQLEAAVIQPDGRVDERVHVETVRSDDFLPARARALPATGETIDGLLQRLREAPDDLAMEIWRHAFDVHAAGSRRREDWLVCQGQVVGAGTDDRVIEIVERMAQLGEKAVPLGGAAIRVEEVDGRLRALPAPGTLCCTLPVVELGMPLVLNARWSLNSSRTHVRFEKTSGGEEAIKVAWNRVLAERVVPEAVANLLEALCSEQDEAAAVSSYAAWPDLNHSSTEVEIALGTGILTALAQRKVLRVAEGAAVRWAAPSEVPLTQPGWSEDLVEALIADGRPFARPTPPQHVLDGLDRVGQPLEALPAAEVRAWLQAGGTDRTCLRTIDRVRELLAFCGEEGRVSLEGLPLAWMDDGTLRHFGAEPVVCVGDPVVRRLFHRHPRWFLHASLEPLATRTTRHLLMMTAPTVVANLKAELPQADGLPGIPGKEPPAAEWLAELCGWIGSLPKAEVEPLVPQLMSYAFVPDRHGLLFCPGHVETPLLATHQLPPSIDDALSAFGVPLVGGSPVVVEALRELAARVPGLVWSTTPDDVVEALEGLDGLPEPSPSDPRRHELLHWLAEACRLGQVFSATLDRLKELALWPTRDGGLVAPTDEDVFLPVGYAPPPEFGELRLLELGEGERWKVLLVALGATPLEVGPWVDRVFLRTYEGLESNLRRAALRWLRDDGLHALDALPDNAGTKVIGKLRMTRLLETGGGETRRPDELYSPEAHKEVAAVLGPVARFPDVRGEYRDERPRWDALFTRLRLRSTPSDADLVARVDQLLGSASTEPAEAEDGLLEVYDHLGKRWEKDPSDRTRDSDLAQKLRERAWVPTLRRPARDDRVALFTPPPARFLRPAEVYPARLLHLGASQVAVLAAREENATVRDALGMPNDVPHDRALAHFVAVRDHYEAGGEQALHPSAVEAAARAFYRYLTQHQKDPATKKMLTTLAGSACVWDPRTRRFWPAAFTFSQNNGGLHGVRVRVSFEVASEDAALDALGRRAEPEPDDHAAVLRELACAHETDPLPEGALKVALRCWRFLEDHPNHCVPDLPAPTVEGRLVPVGETLVDDASYWRDRLASAPLPWLHPSVAERPALAAGAKRVSSVVTEERVSWRVEAAPLVIQRCAELSEHLCCEAFLRGVLRLLAHGLPPDLEDDERPDPEAVAAAVQLQLVACADLRAGLVAPAFGLIEPVGVEAVECLLDEGEVWAASHDREAVAVELARALMRRLTDVVEGGSEEIVNQAGLEEILRVKANRIDAVLNRRKIRTLGRETRGVEDWEEAPLDSPADELDGVGEPEEVHDDEEPDPSPDPDVRRGATGVSSGAGTSPYTAPRPGPEIDAGPRVGGQQPSPGGEPPRTGAAGPPTRPHDGSSAPQARGRGQFYSYLEPRVDTGGPGEAPRARTDTEEAALAHVHAVEGALGRTVVEMPHENEGYDRQITVSGEEGCRYVEVKGLGGAWDARGVRLSPAQLRAAHRLRETYWLYVVEHARDPEQRRLYRIQDPASRVTAYCLDQGWASLAEPEGEAPSPAVGLRVTEDGVPLGVIVAVTPRGTAIRITVERAAGEHVERTWNPERHRIEREDPSCPA